MNSFFVITDSQAKTLSLATKCVGTMVNVTDLGPGLSYLSIPCDMLDMPSQMLHFPDWVEYYSKKNKCTDPIYTKELFRYSSFTGQHSNFLPVCFLVYFRQF